MEYQQKFFTFLIIDMNPKIAVLNLPWDIKLLISEFERKDRFQKISLIMEDLLFGYYIPYCDLQMVCRSHFMIGGYHQYLFESRQRAVAYSTDL